MCFNFPIPKLFGLVSSLFLGFSADLAVSFDRAILLRPLCAAEHFKLLYILRFMHMDCRFQFRLQVFNAHCKTLILFPLIWMWVIIWLKALSTTNSWPTCRGNLFWGMNYPSTYQDSWCHLNCMMPSGTPWPPGTQEPHSTFGPLPLQEVRGICPVCTPHFSQNMQKV